MNRTSRTRLRSSKTSSLRPKQSRMSVESVILLLIPLMLLVIILLNLWCIKLVTELPSKLYQVIKFESSITSTTSSVLPSQASTISSTSVVTSTPIKYQSKTIKPKPKVKKKIKSTKGKHLTKSGGVFYFNGRKETWYSQRILPGGGLKIPGRHVCSQGLIRDKNNYIVVSSSDLRKGTIVRTSLGKGKVYDTGCASGVLDIYTDW